MLVCRCLCRLWFFWEVGAHAYRRFIKYPFKVRVVRKGLLDHLNCTWNICLGQGDDFDRHVGNLSRNEIHDIAMQISQMVFATLQSQENKARQEEKPWE